MRLFAVALLAFWLVPAAAADLDRPVILVAKPNLRDPVYGATVLVVTPLGAGHHVGFIVNRPTPLTLGKMFPEHAPSQKIVDPVYLGGPVEPGLIFALVQQAHELPARERHEQGGGPADDQGDDRREPEQLDGHFGRAMDSQPRHPAGPKAVSPVRAGKQTDAHGSSLPGFTTIWPCMIRWPTPQNSLHWTS